MLVSIAVFIAGLVVEGDAATALEWVGFATVGGILRFVVGIVMGECSAYPQGC